MKRGHITKVPIKRYCNVKVINFYPSLTRSVKLCGLWLIPSGMGIITYLQNHKKILKHISKVITYLKNHEDTKAYYISHFMIPVCHTTCIWICNWNLSFNVRGCGNKCVRLAYLFYFSFWWCEIYEFVVVVAHHII